MKKNHKNLHTLQNKNIFKKNVLVKTINDTHLVLFTFDKFIGRTHGMDGIGAQSIYYVF